MDDYDEVYHDPDYDDKDNDDGDVEDDRDSFDGFPDPQSECSPPGNEASSYKVITKESLLIAQREDLQRAMDLLSLKENHARTLLIHNRWDVDRVFAVFVEKGRDKLFSEAGVTVQEDGVHSSVPCPLEVYCEICLEKVSANKTTAMDCGHCFCNNCWTEHFVVKITGGQSRRVMCMAYKCHAICDEGKIRNLVGEGDPKLAEKFDRFLLESYIEDNKMVKWCPSTPHCGNAIRVENDEYCEVECACGLEFCFSCLSEAHSPCSCLMWKLWTQKCMDESETINWFTVNTKICPRCHKPVEKSWGCNLVFCICGQTFCWLCGGSTGAHHTWNGIDGHTCGRYTNEHLKTKNAKAELSHYMYYHTRYKVHSDSFKAEVKLKERMQVKISKLEARMHLKLKDYSWVMDGFYTLFRSRKILSYSYPFAYYMFGDELFNNEMMKEEKEIKQHLFEDQQQQFEANVEKLSMYLEEPFDVYSERRVMMARLKIITQTALVDGLCKKLYDCIDIDLLLPLQKAIHIIAPYRSKGLPKAVELVHMTLP